MKLPNLVTFKGFRRSYRLITGIVGITLVPPILLIVLSYYQTLVHAKKNLEVAAEQSARRITSLLRAAEITLEELETYLASSAIDEEKAWRLLRLTAYNDPRFREIGIVNEDGLLVLTSLGPVNPPIALNSDTRADLSRKELQVIGPMTTVIMQERSIVLVLPTTGKGELNILVDPILLDAYLDNLGELDLGPEGFSAYVHSSQQQVIVGTGFLPRSATLFADTVNRDHIRVIKPIQDSDIVVLNEVSKKWVLRHWRNLLWLVIPASLVSSFLITLILMRLMNLAYLLDYDIRIGLQNGEFELYYQPIFDVTTGRCTGSEALIRWRHSYQGLLLPNTFIPVSEKTGLITEIGAWVIENVIRDQKKILKQNPHLHVALNLSPVQIKSERSSQAILNFIRKNKDIASQFIFEITENSLIEETQTNVFETIASIRSLGSKVALDDFGTGHCGISYLSQLQIDYLKIDRSFVSASDPNSNVKILFDSIVELGNRLQVELIAEGIEVETQKQAVLHKGIRYGQGWFYGHPMPIKEFEVFLQANA